MKFATRLLVLCLGSVLSITLPVYLFLYYVGLNTLEQQIEQRLHDETAEVMAEIDRLLFEKIADVRLMASVRSIRDSGSTAEITQRLVEYRNHYKIYSSISFFDNNRIRIADTAGFSLDQPADDSIWVKDVFEHDRVSMGNDIHFDMDMKSLMIFLAVPARDVNGNRVGAVVARIPVENFYYVFKELNELNEELNGNTAVEKLKPQVDLIDQSGLLIYSNHNYAKLGQHVDLANSTKVNDHRFIHTIAQEIGYSNFAGNGWTLIVCYPKAAAFATLYQLRNQAIAIGIALLMFAMVAIFLAARRTIRPIIALKNATLQLGKGHFDITVPVMSKDEIGELAISFNQMVQLVKCSKEELRQQEEFLRLVIDNIPQMIFWKDTQSVYLGGNSRISQMNQFKSVYDIVGKTDFELVWKEFAPLYVEDDQQVMMAKQPKLNFVEQIVNEDGTTGWLRTNKIPLFNHEGTVIGVLGTAEIITAQMQAEQLLKQYNQTLEAEVAKRTEDLQKSEERFDLAMKGASDGLWDWNLETHEVYFSPRWKNMLGYEDHEIKNDFSEWSSRVHLDDLESALANTTAYFEKKIPKYELLFRMRHKNGNYVWILSRAYTVWNAEGKAVRAVGTHVDMTAQKQAEEALRKSQQSLAEAQRIAHVGNWEWDIQSDKITWSDEVYRIFGAQPGEFEPTFEIFLNLVHSDDVTGLQQAIAESLQEKKPYSIDHRIVLANNEVRFVHEQGEVVDDERGQPMQMLGITQDITEHKQIEAELVQAKMAADFANQSKSTFLANMSHELRTPLNGILGYTQILSRDKTITPKQQEGIDIIHRSGEYLLTLINDILDLSKIEAGRVELYLTDINFPEFIAGISELFQMRAQQKGINFIYEPLSRLPLGIRVDEKRLRQILINLLGNAVKFTEEGGVTFKIGYCGDNIRFQVEDTGVGIATEDIEKIFQPFQQVGDYHHKAEGTGLGLSITKKLIEMMGGELHIESQLGYGSKFWMALYLPEVSELIKTDKERPPTIIGFKGEPRKLLVIDDKWANRSVMVNLLTPLGFVIIEAENGQEGLEKACEQSFDLIITDLVMPVMDGFEAVRQMRKIPKLQNLPIIAASASVFDYHQQQSKAAGCDDFMSKPFRVETLFELLRKHLNLTWVYAEEEMNTSTKTTDQPIPIVEMPFIGPSTEQASILLDLAMMGDISGVLEALSQLEKEDSRYLPFINKVRQLAKNFDEEQICAMMQQYVT